MSSAIERLKWAITRARVRQMVEAEGGWRANLRLLAGEEPFDIEYQQAYGFAGVPLPGASGVYLAVGGVRGHGLALALDMKGKHPPLQAGEVAVYDDLGKTIVLKRDGTITIDALKVEVTAGSVVVNSGDVSLGGTGGPAVARLGDQVQVGPSIGTIIEGSGAVSAV